MALVIVVTIPEAEAAALAKTLLESKLAACVNIIKGVQSLFWWKGNIDNAHESMLLIKTKDSFYGRIREVVKKNHSYEVPEIIAFKIDEINREYLEWLNQSTAASV